MVKYIRTATLLQPYLGIVSFFNVITHFAVIIFANCSDAINQNV